MQHIVLKDAYVEIDGVDLSDHVRQVTIEYSAAVVEDNHMGVNSEKKKPGLKNARMTIEFAQDYGAAAVDDTLFDLVGVEGTDIEVRPTSAAVSPMNPAYKGTGFVQSYQPLAGQVGQLATSQCVFEVSGDLARVTS